MQRQDLATGKLLKERIQQITPISRMIIFGSRARGDAVGESDMDVFIEVPSVTRELRRKIFDVAWEVGLDREIVVSTIVATPTMLVEGPFAGNPILKAIQKEGIPV